MSPGGAAADMCLIEICRWKILIKNEAGDGKNTTHFGAFHKNKTAPLRERFKILF